MPGSPPIHRLSLAAIALAIAFGFVDGRVAGQLPGAPATPPGATRQIAPAPAGVIAGVVTEAPGGRAVRHAIVRLNGRSLVQTRLTDDKGRFLFMKLPEGDYSLTATKPGFFDGTFGQRRADGAGTSLKLYDRQWILDVKIDVWRAGTIRGYVINEDNDPAVGVEVRAFRRQVVGGVRLLVTSGTSRTDDQGNYRITDLRPGEYVVAVLETHVSLPLATVEAVARTGASTADAQMVFAINGRLAAPGQPGPTISDIELDARGTNVLLPGKSATPPRAVNNKTLIYPSVYYPGSPHASLAFPITVVPGQERSTVDFQLQPVEAARVSGFVTGPAGSESAQVLRLIPDRADDLGLGTETAATIVAPDRTFTFVNVPPGDYLVEARRAGVFNLTSQDALLAGVGPLSPNGPIYYGRAQISVGDRDVSGVVLDMRPGVTITGHVAFEGNTRPPGADALGRIPVVAEPAGAGSLGNLVPARINEDGEFRIAGVAPGRFFVRVANAPPGWSLKSAFSGGRDLSDVALDTSTGLDVTDVVLTFTDQSTEVTGTVRDQRGVQSPDATVIAFSADREFLTDSGLNPRRIRSVRPASSGVYTIGRLPPGDYFLIAIDEADADGWNDPERLETWRRFATRVTIREGDKKVQDLRVTIRRLAGS